MASVEICVKFVKNCFLIYFQELDEFFYGHKKTVSLKVIPLINGADGRSRTGTHLREPAPQAGASTNFTTSAIRRPIVAMLRNTADQKMKCFYSGILLTSELSVGAESTIGTAGISVSAGAAGVSVSTTAAGASSGICAAGAAGSAAFSAGMLISTS